MELTPIAIVASPVREGVDENWGAVVSEIRLRPEYADGLRGLDGFSHALIVFYMHESSFDPATRLNRRMSTHTDSQLGDFDRRK